MPEITQGFATAWNQAAEVMDRYRAEILHAAAQECIAH